MGISNEQKAALKNAGVKVAAKVGMSLWGKFKTWVKGKIAARKARKAAKAAEKK
jgi:hypothetical protein